MFTIHWLGTDGSPTGHTTALDGEEDRATAKTYAEAVWEATKLLRATTKEHKKAVNQGLYPVGFYVGQETS